MNKLDLFNSKHAIESKLKDLRVGWSVKIHQKIKEGEKTRTQAFEGIIISKKHGNEAGGTITVRKVFGGFGVEKTFPIYLPSIEKVQILKKSKVRRAKLYYLRDKTSREIRKKMKQTVITS
ncbi:MAG: 50S ribosomal protein L19 [Candidatus Yanofskybacteria bacterium RIFCSPHIGHO2_02_FULL_38_22b]|uniref:50S ribosomal protein L19 n=1 Tax=Candidatus Yanofskybacteria bacterium RIFCSPHIGHO2_02_FULL_38_22b TaxID=1802673 RepID=A0A1F8EZN2_9BACT|nr:MAG: 50S ribosomal protein L19 [Candidatus Yanofskybacteria bacterium RIFCSPHIGHO2_01_FULL_39_44]OGN06325.1 MAG: 50S ribosomal protein L19 [Candidatus Yanofskybacteria bacterium RIFCSPHIGHO2_02_FULL_38_22b]OGN19790.1 MAG: 50S ribosomal protein L19 [Candidatus Yanofskybacteria bacterium RIFCSPLOWO2_01_FULL_39_28]